MKKSVLVLSTLLMVLGVFAQGPGAGKKEKIESYKIAFITEKLALSPEEAQKFWPVYNKYNAELEKTRKDFYGQMSDELKNVDQMSDSEADKAINDMISFRTKEIETTKKYAGEFKKVIGSQKTVKLFAAEQEFKKELLKILREKQQSRGR